MEGGNIPGNYRPISVLPAISKILMQIMLNQLYNYLAKNFLAVFNSVFEKSSTTTTLIDCMKAWYMTLSRKENVYYLTF